MNLQTSSVSCCCLLFRRDVEKFLELAILLQIENRGHSSRRLRRMSFLLPFSLFFSGFLIERLVSVTTCFGFGSYCSTISRSRSATACFKLSPILCSSIFSSITFKSRTSPLDTTSSGLLMRSSESSDMWMSPSIFFESGKSTKFSQVDDFATSY